MIKPPNLKLARWVACALVAVCVAAFVVSTATGPERAPRLVCAAFDPKTRITIVVLTNATNRDWSFPVNVVRGLPKPSYWVAPEKSIPGWCWEFEEGILGAGWIYSRDPSGRYVRSQVLGPPHQMTVARSNIVLHPKEFLRFSVPLGDIPGLTKVGVFYEQPHALPLVSPMSPRAPDIGEQIRRWLHLKPAAAFRGWCETSLPATISAN
jgi:hypothetical protein